MIDCGLIVEMGEQDHVNLVKVLGAFIKRDGHRAGELMIDTAKKCQATDMDVELFCHGLQQIIHDDNDQVSISIHVVEHITYQWKYVCVCVIVCL